MACSPLQAQGPELTPRRQRSADPPTPGGPAERVDRGERPTDESSTPDRRPTPAAIPSPPPRPERPQAPLATALNVRGDLTLRNSSLSGALFTVGELWGINIVSGKLEGNVNGVFKNAPLHEILDTILLSNGYGYRAVGESLVVTDLNRLGQVNPF
ncbi:MAG: hypothetical protein AAF596_00780, partial [Planctomycetota bacterium]